jgi:serine/threonine protein phosphatase 1
MATYVVGDLHGQAPLFERLLEKIRFDRTVDRIIATGDVLDRGAGIGDLLTRLYEGSKEGWFLSVRGNHEASFLRLRDGDSVPFYEDPEFGGTRTLEFFGRLGHTRARAFESWLSSWPLVWSDTNHIVVHGGLPAVPGTRQGDILLCETRLSSPGTLHECLDLRPPNILPSWDGRIVVSGHTIVRRAKVYREGIIMVDTGAYRTGRLSAYCLETGKFHSVQGIPC